MARRSSIAAAALVAAAAAAAPAHGHGEGAAAAAAAAGRFVTVLEQAPALPGLRVTVHDGRLPAIFVRNDSGHTLEVLAGDGRPGIRIGPHGVELRTAGAHGRWSRANSRPAWAWLERRAHLPARGAARADLGPRRRTVLRWATPMRLGGRPLELRARVDWIPAVARATPLRCAVAPWCGAPAASA